MTNACILFNPAAGRGASANHRDAIKKAFALIGVATLLETDKEGDEERLALEAIARGFRTIIVAGGDGTCGRVADAILKSDERCRLAVMPTGTGNDFAKTLGVTGYTPEQVADLVARGQSTEMDVGQVDGRYFINSCGFGFDPAVLDASNRVRFLKGNAIYIYTAITKLFIYRGTRVLVRGVAGVEDGAMLMVTVSNGRSLGGAFRIAPTASVRDGKLDVCFFRDAGVLERLRLFAGALHGTHLGMHAVSSAKIQRLILTFEANPLIEMDGELRMAESTSVEVSVVPSALSVLAAPGALV